MQYHKIESSIYQNFLKTDGFVKFSDDVLILLNYGNENHKPISSAERELGGNRCFLLYVESTCCFCLKDMILTLLTKQNKGYKDTTT